ncbi:MAG: hypothetical protein IIA05_06010 [Proteobacteria bacterium]|nr:hypothetical protein [Pseudomonadota bacterium]
MSELEREDIQGIILRGYEEMDAACLVLLQITDVDRLREWLKRTSFTNATRKPVKLRRDRCLNIAFTRPGLDKFDETKGIFEQVSRQFHEGMVGPEDHGKSEHPEDSPHIHHRQRLLGDIGESAPYKWVWGYDSDELERGDLGKEIHLLVMLYAPDEAQLANLYNKVAGGDVGFKTASPWGGTPGGEASGDEKESGKDFQENGMKVVRVLSTRLLPGRKEHFGFRDGIAQPVVKGSGVSGRPDNVIDAGEFLFGYPNIYQRFPIPPKTKNNNHFGRNGSFLVFRQLSQDVPGFWKFVREQVTGDVQQGTWLASKMVGRWPSGAPMVLAPFSDNPALQDEDGFGFYDIDRYGFRCPFGSHMRRTNPRDSFPGASEKSSVHGRHHRIIRRGRAYGPPLAGQDFIKGNGTTICPEKAWGNKWGAKDTVVDNNPGELVRGLHFMCFNANIARQFESIQSAWIMSPKFGGLSEDPDPIMGDHSASKNVVDPLPGSPFRPKWPSGHFTIQQEPVQRRLDGLKRFVHVRGGAYFFMPGIRALRYLAGI